MPQSLARPEGAHIIRGGRCVPTPSSFASTPSRVGLACSYGTEVRAAERVLSSLPQHALGVGSGHGCVTAHNVGWWRAEMRVYRERPDTTTAPHHPRRSRPACRADAGVAVGSGLLVATGVILPWLAVLGVLGLAALLIVRGARRRRARLSTEGRVGERA